MKYKPDNQEKEILDDYENEEYIEVPDMDKTIEKHTGYAKATFLKNKRINIRISQRDLEKGIPYQTLIASLIHSYISGKLVEKDKVLMNQ
ncbi:MAG: antitoxin [Actinobacteria bacterium]|nr:antitoxin [Actinomycetota bacterium]MBM3713817.1 antitoxin [Actinomycetota bacterium]